MKTERNKRLTEAMGECWHEWDNVVIDSFYTRSSWVCLKCGQMCGGSSSSKDSDEYDNNFSTWEGFGKLWEWAQKQEWWNNFRNKMYCGWNPHNTGRPDELCYILIHPDSFADAVYEYLKETGYECV